MNIPFNFYFNAYIFFLRVFLQYLIPEMKTKHILPIFIDFFNDQ